MVENTQRKNIVGGNWKCNGSLESVRTLVSETLNKMEWNQDRCEVVVCPLTMHIASVKAQLNDKVNVGA